MSLPFRAGRLSEREEGVEGESLLEGVGEGGSCPEGAW